MSGEEKKTSRTGRSGTGRCRRNHDLREREAEWGRTKARLAGRGYSSVRSVAGAFCRSIPLPLPLSPRGLPQRRRNHGLAVRPPIWMGKRAGGCAGKPIRCRTEPRPDRLRRWKKGGATAGAGAGFSPFLRRSIGFIGLRRRRPCGSVGRRRARWACRFRYCLRI